ncbi:MAG: TldD/PmbA family protein [Spirochaetes bacterium]|nr:TldD/PmbA family protein [Spirochaetota bacterium]
MLLTKIEEIRRILMSLNCEFADVRFTTADSSSIVLSNDEIENMGSGISQAGSIRIFDKGRWSFTSFNDFSGFEKFARAGMENIGYMSPDAAKGLMSALPLKMNKVTDVQIDFTSVGIDEKYQMLCRYNRILKNHEKIERTSVLYRDVHSDYCYLNTEGSEITYDKYFCGVAFTSVAKNGTDIQPFHESIAGYGGFELVNNQDSAAENVIKTAVEMLSAEQVKGGEYDVILDQRMAGVFIHEAFGHLSEADFVCNNDRMKSVMVLGKKFAPEFFNVIDDGNIENTTGYIPADDEGILPEKTYLIKDGKLNARLHSRETANMMKENVTGNGRAISAGAKPIVRMTNTYIENGQNTKEELFENVKDGIYAVNFHGGQTNLEMFTFSSAYGYEIKDGKIGKLLKNVVLTGNVFETLKNIKMLANDREMYGGLGGCGKMGQSPLPVAMGGPHVLIEKVLIGGNQ